MTLPIPASAARLAAFEGQRPRLLRLGYRMLGSLAESEDIVQEAWLRWSRVEEAVDAPSAYLTRIVTRLCLDQMKSARARRETYYGTWLPEPLMEASAPEAELADDMTLTLMLALERLSPLERAAFLLHDVFGVALADVPHALDRDAGAVRQLAVRARRHVQSDRPRYRVEQGEADRIARAFFTASRDGDAAALSSMLAHDVIVHSDGGGRVPAFRNIIHGIDRVLRLYAGLARKQSHRPDLIRTMQIDGLPGYASIDRGQLLQTTALERRDGKITAIYIMRNPDKLRHVALALGLRSDDSHLFSRH
jgi:RNA polymerase sigma-70 factor (ECF subfamily)